TQGGGRWNISAESRALNMSAGDLLAYTINRIDKKFKEYGKTIVMHDTSFMPGLSLSYPGDPDPLWIKALPKLPKDVHFLVWHPKEVNEVLASYSFGQFYLSVDEQDWRKMTLPGPYLGLAAYMAESSFTPAKLLDICNIAWNATAPRPRSDAAMIN